VQRAEARLGTLLAPRHVHCPFWSRSEKNKKELVILGSGNELVILGSGNELVILGSSNVLDCWWGTGVFLLWLLTGNAWTILRRPADRFDLFATWKYSSASIDYNTPMISLAYQKTTTHLLRFRFRFRFIFDAPPLYIFFDWREPPEQRKKKNPWKENSQSRHVSFSKPLTGKPDADQYLISP
jgi:hypothetical protein